MWASRAPPTDKQSGLIIKCGVFAVVGVLMIALVFAKFYGINIIIAIMLFALCSLVIIGALAETRRDTSPILMSTIGAPQEECCGGIMVAEEEVPPPPYSIAVGDAEGLYGSKAPLYC